MYLFGESVPEDHVDAAYWYELAARLGDATSMHALGLICALHKNMVDAYKWWSLAADHGDEKSN